jgi:SAM-dependent methyltransferase
VTKPLFDEYGDTYRDEVQKSIDFIGRDHSFFTRAKARLLLELATNELGDPASVRALDVGCGPGETDALLAGRFASLDGVDISEAVVETARTRNPGVAYRTYDGRRLPYEDGAFDLVFTICVVHHVPPAEWEAFVAELARVVRPGGVLAIVEHNPFNPLTRLAVSRCEFDDDATLLRPSRTESLVRRAGLALRPARFIIFFPWETPLLTRAEHGLARVPLGAQYVVTGIRTG